METECSSHDVCEIFTKLNEKFGNNLEMSLESDYDKLRDIEIKARYFAALGQILREKESPLQHQQEITLIFDEVFADTILSVYLAGCSLDKPAQIILRRALEMGISIVYLWDLPHEFWGWRCNDKDLHFRNMTDHLLHSNYMTFIKSINTQYNPDKITHFRNVTELYRDLSNTTHGKMSTFETNLPDRFSQSSGDWEEHLNMVEKVQNVLLELFGMRFFDTFQELNEKMPSIKKK